jgi:hypothetical protein
VQEITFSPDPLCRKTHTRRASLKDLPSKKSFDFIALLPISEFGTFLALNPLCIAYFISKGD